MDHIPHNDKSNPDKDNENSFTKYNISLLIPNVDCPSCSLQLLYIMTDKTTSCNIPVCRYNELDTACKGSTDLNTDPCLGAPNGNVCIDSNECFSNCMFNHYWLYFNQFYLCLDHSCADIIIKGVKPIKDFDLVDRIPSIWPYKNKTNGYYSKESANWENGWLKGIPSNFTKIYPKNRVDSYNSKTMCKYSSLNEVNIWLLINIRDYGSCSNAVNCIILIDYFLLLSV